jgi:hypothetical protein
MNAFWAAVNFDAFMSSTPPSQGITAETLPQNDPTIRKQSSGATMHKLVKAPSADLVLVPSRGNVGTGQ